MAFSTKTEIQDILSELGLEEYVRDEPTETDPETDTSRIANAIERADAEIVVLLRESYPSAQLELSTYVKWASAHMATAHIVRRRHRDVPESLMAAVEEYRTTLSEMGRGERPLPGAVPTALPIPVVSNYVFDSRGGSAKARVQKRVSTGRSASPFVRHVSKGSLDGRRFY